MHLQIICEQYLILQNLKQDKLQILISIPDYL